MQKHNPKIQNKGKKGPEENAVHKERRKRTRGDWTKAREKQKRRQKTKTKRTKEKGSRGKHQRKLGSNQPAGPGPLLSQSSSRAVELESRNQKFFSSQTQSQRGKKGNREGSRQKKKKQSKRRQRRQSNAAQPSPSFCSQGNSKAREELRPAISAKSLQNQVTSSFSPLCKLSCICCAKVK